jgi:hypothetical protein
MLDNLGNIGDFIGGIGVVVTLIYLVTQIRQNTRALRLSSIQQIMGTSVSVNHTASAGPIPGIAAKLESRERLTGEEFAQYVLFIWAMLTHHWQIFYQHQHGMIDDAVFEAYKARLHAILGTSLSSAIWRSRIKSGFPVEFQQYVEEQLDGG